MLLLDRGADVDAANPRGTALHIAAFLARTEVVDVLLHHGADVCLSGRLCMPNCSLTAGDMSPMLQPNKIATCVYTPLVSALVGGSLKCINLLILVPHCII